MWGAIVKPETHACRKLMDIPEMGFAIPDEPQAFPDFFPDGSPFIQKAPS